MSEPGDGSAGPGSAPATAERLFGIIWTTLTSFLGSATTATLLRRTQKAVQRRGVALDDLVIRREGLDYQYEVPACWREGGEASGRVTFDNFIDELRPILAQLTGPVLLRRLDASPEFRQSNIFFLEGALS